ncbi:TrkH family potassium uptake protein [Thermostaphylospora chromogena]|nr:potassium transporter TrkG [Thermostaphylospora chromogena]
MERFDRPGQLFVAVFGMTIVVGTILLMVPGATTSGEPAGLVTALFTATSAVTVTGLTVTDTSAYWSTYGEVVIIALAQVGGLGIMTTATVFTILVSGRIGLRARLAAQVESAMLHTSDLRRVVRDVVLFSLAWEAVTAVVLTVRLVTGYGEPLPKAVYLGVYHSISAFNNAGFVLWPDGLTRFVEDPWISVPVAFSVIAGGLGFPVVFELLRSWRRPSRWSLMARITVGVSVVLLVSGTFVFLVTEWYNPKTLGPLDGSGKLLAAFFTAVMPRSGGLNTIDVTGMYPSSWLVTDALMFIGGGSASVAGGIKVTTFGLLIFILWAEMRGETHVNIGHRRVSESVQRQAVVLTILSSVLVALSTYLLLVLNPHTLDEVLFEVVSAFSTTGLSVGVSAESSAAGQMLLALLMFVGRVGPVTLGSALALRERTRRYELPEERVIVG